MCDELGTKFRYVLSALKFNNYASVGYAPTHTVTREMKTTFGIQPQDEHLLMFDEKLPKPIVRLQGRKIAHQDMDSAFAKHKFLK